MPKEFSSADIGRLTHYSGLELNDAIKSYLDARVTPSSAQTLANFVKQRIRNDEYILNENIARILKATPDSELFESAKSRIFSDVWSLLTIYKSRFPDAEIEAVLAKFLVECAQRDDDPRRRYIVEAFRDVGSKDVLPTLEMLFEDIKPSATVRALFSQHLGTLETVSAKSRLSFVRLLAEAIEKIGGRREKAIVADKLDATEPATAEIKPPEYNKYLERAKAMVSSDPESAIVYLRKGAENLAKEAYRCFGVDDKKIDKLTLGPLIEKLKPYPELHILYIFLSTISPISNFASHDQDGKQSEIIDEGVAKSLVGIFSEAIKSYKKLVEE